MLQYRHYVVSRISYNCWLHRLRHRNDRRMQSSSRCSPANSWRCSDVLSTCFRRQYANVLRSRFEGQEMKGSYLVFQSALMTKLTKATNATTTIAKTQRRWHHQHPIKKWKAMMMMASMATLGILFLSHLLRLTF